ncbi:MAG: hypothetical protein LBC79_10425, partial [Deltaproteobacteria bacterium]|nr:hypothetical protein [Deltaproteobacteria bacterium]
MTIESLIPVNRYLGDGVQTAFPVDFPVFGDGRHVKAVISTGSGSTLEEQNLVYGLDYAVSEVPGGGECVATAPVPAGRMLTLYLDLPYVQPRDFDNQGRLDAEEIEKGLDYVTALTMQNAQALLRTVKVPIGSGQSPEDLIQELFTARDEACACRDESCECAEQATDMLERGIAAADRAEALIDGAVISIENATQQGLASIITEGQSQVNRVAVEGAAFVNQARGEADRAFHEANRAAGIAEDLANVSDFGPATRTRLGVVRIGDGIAVTEDGTISVRFPTVVSTPSVSFPELAGIGFEYEALFSAETGAAGAEIDYFEVWVDDNPVARVAAADNMASLAITPAGASGSVGRIVVIAVDTVENVSLAATTTFIKNTVTVHAPAIISPAPLATGVSLTPTIQIQAANISGVIANPDQTHIQVASDALFTTIVAEHQASNGYTTTYTLPQLVPSTMYYVRARHHYPVYGWSAWGNAGSFTTMSASVSVPVISAPANGAVDVVLSGPLVLQEFVVAGQTHQYMQIQLASDQNFANVVYDSGSVAPATSHPFSPDLAKSTIFHARARNYGTITGWTAWSAAVSFTTQAVGIGDATFMNSSGTFTAPSTGCYTLECAAGSGGGASGTYWSYCDYGSGLEASSSYISANGGLGGFAKSVNVPLAIGQTITVVVGSAGGNASASGNYICPQSEHMSTCCIVMFGLGACTAGYGGAGGSSSIAGYISATGGGGGYITWSSGCTPNMVNGGNGNGSGGNNANGASGSA